MDTQKQQQITKLGDIQCSVEISSTLQRLYHAYEKNDAKNLIYLTS